MNRLSALLLAALLAAAPVHAKPAHQHRKPAPAKAVDVAGEQVNFGEWKAVADFEDQMVQQHGFTREELDATIKQTRFIEAAIQLVKPAPPGKPKNWAAYRKLFIEPQRIAAGVAFWDDNAGALARAEEQYGVPAEIIVGIIGVETYFGRLTGRFRTVDVLMTLAFAYPETPNREARMAFFRSELGNTLLYARAAGVDPLSLQGSFAGAIGLPQFMPGNILKYGVDYDGDGKIDLRGSAADAIGSVANFLVQHGWQREQQGELVYPAKVSPTRAWEKFINAGLTAQFTPEEMAAAGVATDTQPPSEQLVGLVDLQNGAEPTTYWLASNNFFTITQYNRSYFYAMSVVELGRAIHAALPVDSTFLQKQ